MSEPAAKKKLSIEVTPAAIAQVVRLTRKRLAEGKAAPEGLRIGLRGGGCDGFSYVFEWADKPAAIRDHVLLPWASRIEQADRRLRPQLDEGLFARVIDEIPESWLAPEPGVTVPERRAGYVTFLTRRLETASAFVEEAARARAQLV